MSVYMLLKECQFTFARAPAPAVSHQSDVLASEHSYDAPVATATILKLTCECSRLSAIQYDLASIEHSRNLVARIGVTRYDTTGSMNHTTTRKEWDGGCCGLYFIQCLDNEQNGCDALYDRHNALNTAEHVPKSLWEFDTKLFDA